MVELCNGLIPNHQNLVPRNVHGPLPIGIPHHREDIPRVIKSIRNTSTGIITTTTIIIEIAKRRVLISGNTRSTTKATKAVVDIKGTRALGFVE